MRQFFNSFIQRGMNTVSQLKSGMPRKGIFFHFEDQIINKQVVNSMPLENLLPFINEFYMNYNSFNSNPKIESKLQEDLCHRISTMRYSEAIEIIFALTIKSKFSAEISKDLVINLMDLISNHKEQLQITDLKLVSNLIKFITKYNISSNKFFETIFKKYSVKYLEELNDLDLSSLCSVLSKIGMENKYFDIKYDEGTSIYTIIENRVKKTIETILPKQLFGILKCFVINDRGNEDLIKQMESRVFSNVSLFLDKELADIPFFYQKRVMFPSDYLIENVYKKVYNEFTNRFEQINPLSKSLFLINYWKNSTFHGMYCDNRLTEKIKKELFDNKFDLLPITKMKKNVYTTCLSYMAHARQLDNKTIDYYIGRTKKNYNLFDQDYFLKSAVYLSRYPGINPEFWEMFVSKLKKKYVDVKDYASLYCIWLNCRLRDQASIDIIKEVFTEAFVKEINKEWKIQRDKDIKRGLSSHTHKELMLILQKMDVKFIPEYYEEYYIDLALPDYKVGIEINGPGHFLFPQKIFNGKTENKRILMEKLGWKLYSYRYFDYTENSLGVKDFINRVVPLDY